MTKLKAWTLFAFPAALAACGGGGDTSSISANRMDANSNAGSTDKTDRTHDSRSATSTGHTDAASHELPLWVVRGGGQDTNSIPVNRMDANSNAGSTDKTDRTHDSRSAASTDHTNAASHRRPPLAAPGGGRHTSVTAVNRMDANSNAGSTEKTHRASDFGGAADVDPANDPSKAGQPDTQGSASGAGTGEPNRDAASTADATYKVHAAMRNLFTAGFQKTLTIRHGAFDGDFNTPGLGGTMEIQADPLLAQAEAWRATFQITLQAEFQHSDRRFFTVHRTSDTYSPSLDYMELMHPILKCVTEHAPGFPRSIKAGAQGLIANAACHVPGKPHEVRETYAITYTAHAAPGGKLHFKMKRRTEDKKEHAVTTDIYDYMIEPNGTAELYGARMIHQTAGNTDYDVTAN